MIYHIEANKIPMIVIKKIMLFLFLILGILSIILFWTSKNLAPGGSMTAILLRESPKFSMIISFIVALSFYQLYNLYKSMAFQVTNDAVIKFFQKEKLNVINKLGAARANQKFGSEQGQVIPYALIRSIDISPSRIKIKAANYNTSNKNGAITIPCETIRYEELVTHFEKIKKDFGLYRRD